SSRPDRRRPLRDRRARLRTERPLPARPSRLPARPGAHAARLLRRGLYAVLRGRLRPPLLLGPTVQRLRRARRLLVQPDLLRAPGQRRTGAAPLRPPRGARAPAVAGRTGRP